MSSSRILLLDGFLGLTLVFGCGVPAAAGASVDGDLLHLEGRAVCLENEANAADGKLCNQPGAHFAFRAVALQTGTGELYYFLEDDPKAEMFIDPRIRAQPLRIEGWLREGRRFELLSVYSIKDGHLHSIHYRCDVCDITATAPGPCWCCGREFDLREEPVSEHGP